jgi:hypothetical protein
LPKENIALLALHLTFGGAACPYERKIVSETISNLTTELFLDETWDTKTLTYPLQHLVPPARFIHNNIPFTEGKELDVDIPINDKGTHRMYIDDLIGLTINLPNSDNIF